MAPKILVLTTEPLPLPGLPTTGAGLRAWSLGFGLRGKGGAEVVMGFAADSVRGREVPVGSVPGVETFERGELDQFVAQHRPDAVVFQHWGLMAEMRRDPGCSVAIDLAGPHLLERRLWNSPDPEADLREKIKALARADFVTCSGTFQRHYFLPFLIQAGHNPRSTLCPVIPFSLSPGLPEPAEDRECDTFVFSGMFLPWQDPETTLRTLVSTLEEKGKGKLLFIGGPHPSGDVSQGRFDKLQEFLEGHPQVEMAGVMAFDDLLARLRRCGAAVDLMPSNAERELAFPTRTVTFLWAGLPVLHNNYDELAEPIDRAKAGWTFDPGDMAGFTRVVSRLLSHHEDVRRRSENARELVRKHYTWDKTIEPLAAWCADPRPREGKDPVMVPVTVSPGDGGDKKGSARGSRKRDALQPRPVRVPPPLTDTSRSPWYLQPIVFLFALPLMAVLVFLLGIAELIRVALRRN